MLQAKKYHGQRRALQLVSNNILFSFRGKSNPKRLKFITLSSPKADRRLIRPETVEDVARYSLDDDEDGVELMETESGDLNLVLEDTQTQQV